MVRLEGESARDWYLRICMERDEEAEAATGVMGPIRPGVPFPLAQVEAEMAAEDRYELLRVEANEAHQAMLREAGI